MPGFQRRAKWLNAIFPASDAPAVQDPGERSADVSLVQPYDGGGYGYEKTDFFNAFAASASGNIDVLETGPDEVARVLAISAHFLVLAAPRHHLIWISTIGNLFSGTFGIYGGGLYYQVGSNLLTTEPTLYTDHMPVVPPNTRIQFSYDSGDVTTEVAVAALFIRAPLGTVFYS